MADYNDWKDQITIDEFKLLNEAEIPFDFAQNDDLIENWLQHRPYVEDESHEEIIDTLKDWIGKTVDDIEDMAWEHMNDSI